MPKMELQIAKAKSFHRHHRLKQRIDIDTYMNYINMDSHFAAFGVQTAETSGMALSTA